MTEHGCTRPQLGDLLSAYELGMLEAEDRKRFESHLDSCSACLEDLYQGALTSEAFRARPAHYADLLNRSARAAAPSPGKRLLQFLGRLTQPRILVPIGAVAAVALALMILLPSQLPTQNRTSGHLAAIEALPYESLDLRGGVGQDLDRLLAQGMDHYAAGNYGGAAASLAPVWEQAGDDPEWNDRHQAALFLGLCLLLDGRPDEAVEPLEAAGQATLLPIAERGRWYLAQAHLLREAPEASLPLLESLLQSPVYGDQAAAQLQSVREICDNSHGK